MDAAIAAVNTGAIYKYVNKPWDPQQLQLTLQLALEFFMVSAERDQLLREKMSVLRNMMIADRIVSLGLLAAGLSHHIKNSMVAVKTFLELAPMKMEEEKTSVGSLRDPGFWQEYHHSVQSQIEKINALLADLRTASENNTTAPFADEIQIKPVVAAILTGLEPALNARQLVVKNEISENLPAIRVDLPKFNRMVELLLKDELAMLPAGSQIHLTAEEIIGGVRPEVVIRLTDNGPALPPDALRVVLNPFTGGAPSEYGINLLACFFIAHHHGGTIEAHSPATGGNVFNVQLPVKPEPTIESADDTQFLKKALLNEQLWDKLIAN
jgi:two-component system probable response regulator PhcQ